jgi:hypothetical protein
LEPEWCRQINPFTLTPEIQRLVESNFLHTIRGYLSCSLVNYVIFSHGFHGPRRQILDGLMATLADADYVFIPIGLTCSEEESIRRMTCDGRDHGRIKRAISSRSLYEGLPYPCIDSSNLSIDEVVDQMMRLISVASESTTKRVWR